MTEPAKNGDRVRVHYTGRLEDGQVFDSSKGGDPLEFTVGAGDVIPGFDDAVRGMNVGDSRTDEGMMAKSFPSGSGPTNPTRFQVTPPSFVRTQMTRPSRPFVLAAVRNIVSSRGPSTM